MSHANARFAAAARLLMIQRIEAGMSQAHVVRQMGGRGAPWRSGGAATALRRGRIGGPVDSASPPSSTHTREARGADLPAAAQYSSGTCASVGVDGDASIDGVADPPALRAEPARPHRPVDWAGDTPPSRAIRRGELVYLDIQRVRPLPRCWLSGGSCIAAPGRIGH